MCTLSFNTLVTKSSDQVRVMPNFSSLAPSQQPIQYHYPNNHVIPDEAFNDITRNFRKMIEMFPQIGLTKKYILAVADANRIIQEYEVKKINFPNGYEFKDPKYCVSIAPGTYYFFRIPAEGVLGPADKDLYENNILYPGYWITFGVIAKGYLRSDPDVPVDLGFLIVREDTGEVIEPSGESKRQSSIKYPKMYLNYGIIDESGNFVCKGKFGETIHSIAIKTSMGLSICDMYGTSDKDIAYDKRNKRNHSGGLDMVPDHLDGSGTNCNLDNLELVAARENTRRNNALMDEVLNHKIMYKGKVMTIKEYCYQKFEGEEARYKSHEAYFFIIDRKKDFNKLNKLEGFEKVKVL